jgi:cellulose synthase/poly-beta-1,6-N-acetylglucosamine synthase-like glycosyltransferase
MLLTLIALLAIPLVMVLVDTFGGLRASRKTYTFAAPTGEQDFEVLVPIWGKIDYLENVEYLRQYRARVILCTTGDESADFYTALTAVAARSGFRIFRDAPTAAETTRTATNKQRATSGTIRDRVIRNALLTVVRAPYVIPLDADSTTTAPISQLVSELVRQNLDLASIRLVPRNSAGLLAKLQRFEYRLAMQFRFVAAWMVSGACHVARTEVLRDVMNHHSLFFQGNDVETGLIATERGYAVGHIPFEVQTTVPATVGAWWRQRLAWAGGEFRLFIINIRFGLKHPFLWTYGAVIAILAFPLRWWFLTSPAWALLVGLGLYFALAIYLHLKSRSGWILLVPIYTLFSSLILTPLGIIWYFRMALADNNFGIIRPHRSVPASN